MRLDLLRRIYRLKVTLVALAALAVGISLLVLSRSVQVDGVAEWLRLLPLNELGGTLTAAGLFGIVWDYIDNKDKDAREDERIRRLLKESAPEFRDAVVRGFAVSADDLKRVATPELLDGIATNVLGLRLKDKDFASEVYADIRDQAIRAPERWYGVTVKIKVARPKETAATSSAYEVVVQWEYTTVPAHEVHRFACVSNRDEFQELVRDTPYTSTWFLTPRLGFDARNRESFELLLYAVDGEMKPIRRSERKSGQTYSVSLGAGPDRTGKPVRVSYLYRTITPDFGHLLHVDVDQPTRGFTVELDYSDTDISEVSVLDLVASRSAARVERLPADLPGKSLSVRLDGWIFPRTGFAFVWTLDREKALQPRGKR